MALMQITIIPMGTGTPSVGKYVADIQELLASSDIEHELNDMGTLLHGNARELLDLAADIHEHPFTRGAQRIVTNIILDDRRDLERDRGIGDKKKAVLDLMEEREREK